MSKLEDLTVGSNVIGLVNNEAVQVVAFKWFGSSVMELTYKNSQGLLASQLLYREDEARLEVQDASLPWSFDADGDLTRLASEAYRINLAHIFDPYLAVHTSSIEPLPHQISAVYQEMLPRLPLRYILADDPGAGKTIMTGLLLKELIIRGDLKRCLIVSPGSLSEQWQDELYSKFNLKFDILTNDRFESAVSGNVFNEVNLCIVRLDKLARSELLQEKLKATEWDLIVVDEAHKMSATVWGGEVKYTKRFQLGKLLSDITRHYLLLTATPHNGKEEDFQRKRDPASDHGHPLCDPVCCRLLSVRGQGLHPCADLPERSDHQRCAHCGLLRNDLRHADGRDRHLRRLPDRPVRGGSGGHARAQEIFHDR